MSIEQRTYQRRSLSELKELAKIAAANHPMTNIAFQYPPSACIEKAKQAGYTDHEAQSIRWLSIIKRDYGTEVFEEFTNEALRNRLMPRRIHSEAEFLAEGAKMLSLEIEGVHNTIDFFAGTDKRILQEALSNLPNGIKIADLVRSLEEAAQKLRGIEAYVG